MFGFAKQSTGDVAVTSEVGRGSTFTLYLPLAPVPSGRTEADRPEPEPLDADACILVVEDNKEVGEFATRALTELGSLEELAKVLARAISDR